MGYGFAVSGGGQTRYYNWCCTEGCWNARVPWLYHCEIHDPEGVARQEAGRIKRALKSRKGKSLLLSAA